MYLAFYTIQDAQETREIEDSIRDFLRILSCLIYDFNVGILLFSVN